MPCYSLFIFQTETALMYDAVILFAKGLHQVAGARDINTMSLSCTKQNTWNHGNSLLNYMKTVHILKLFWNTCIVFFLNSVECAGFITSRRIQKYYYYGTLYIYIYIYVCVCVCVYIYIYMHIQTHIRACIHTHTNIKTDIYIHT